MPSITATQLGVYRHDALDRLATLIPAGQEGIKRFYQQDRLTSELRGAEGYTLLQAEHRLLAVTDMNASLAGSNLLATDHLSSVLCSVNRQQHQSFAYAPYGASKNPRVWYTPAYTGVIPDPITGHYPLGTGTRAFNPVLMRFNSPDTSSPFLEGGLNAYAYCLGDPVNYSDPTGHFPVGALGMLITGMRKTTLPAARITSSVEEEIAVAEASVIQTVHKALTRNTAKPVPMTEVRKHLDDTIRNLNKDPFTMKLIAVNRNLASHGDNTLTAQQAAHYGRLAKLVSSGKASNAGAHASAAVQWGLMLRTGSGHNNSLVGMTFNMVGALISGPTDHALLKTGNVLRRGS